MKREIALLTLSAALGLMGWTGYDVTYARPLLTEITKIAQASLAPEPTWYNCLTREMWGPDKRAWCQKVNLLKNATHTLPQIGTFQLKNGVYENKAKRHRVVMLNKPGAIAFGDLTQDSKDDAATLLVASTGGSGVFVYLTATVNAAGKPKQVASILLGDRIRVEALSVNANQIKVDLIAHAPKDPQCCPTQKATRLYALDKNTLVPLLKPALTN